MTTYRVEQIKGRWNVVRYQGETRQKRVVGQGSEAKRRADLIAAELTAREARASMGLAPTTFKDYAEKWYREVVVPHKRAGTAHGYRSILDLHLLPLLGTLSLGEVTREHVRVLARKPLARNSVRNILATLRAILNEAVEDGVLTKNPAARLKRFMPTYDPRAAIEALEEEQVAKLLRAAEKHLPDHALMIRLLFYTGVRQGEAFGLRWADVDHTRKLLHVRRSIDYRRGQTVVNTPKSGKGRLVDMPASLARALSDRLSVLQAKAKVTGGNVPPWVFPSIEDPEKPMVGSSFYHHVWAKLFAHAGVPYVKPHNTRHTYASLLLRRGVPIAYVKEQLGHSSIDVTIRNYAHFVPGADRQHVERHAEALEKEIDGE